MEGPSGAARSAGSPSPTEPPASDQTALEKIPVVPSCPMPASGTPWILGRPSAGALSSITVPIRLDALSYLLNSALMGAYSALPQTPLYGGQGALALGHGAPPQQALGCRCQPHYCCAPLPACANPQQAQVGCYGSSAVGQSSAGYSQGISGVRGDWQDFSPRWERRGSPSPKSWGENGRARGQKDFSRPWGGQRPRGEEESAPRKAGLWNPGSRRAPGSDYAARKRNQDGRPWDAPGAKRWSSGCPQRWGSGPGETKAAKATGEDWEADYAGSTAQRSISEKAKSSQAGLPASQEGEDWEKEYEEPPKSVPAVPPPAEVPSKVQAASGQEKKTPRPAAKDSTFSSYLQNLFSDVQRGSSAGSEPRRAGKAQGGAAEAYWNATRAFMILSALSCFAGIITGILSFAHPSTFERYNRSFAAGIMFFVSTLFVLLAMAIYTGVTVNFLGKRFGDWRFSWSYILGWVALLMAFFAGIFYMCAYRMHGCQRVAETR